ncbi:MAG: DNA recombination protein RmuC [Bacilli bacterium]|nr:DNA recombination protein RmuC [Bacilli bacterium]MBN2696466.1 DNA recombination protein RmuC [Bacilli bacterium]
MDLGEIFGLISVVLLVLILAATIYYFFVVRSKDNGQDELNKMENTLLRQVEDLKLVMTKSIYESMMNFNQEVNNLLLETNTKSNASITEFRMNVNKELVSFEQQISDRLKNEIKELANELEKRMANINKNVEERLTQGFVDTNQTFVQIAQRVQVIDEAQKKIESLSTEMIGLQNILSNNQARGSFGEFQLIQLLRSVYGDNDKIYLMQYTMKEASGKRESVRADAVIFVPEPHNMVAIDSKFPFSSYSKLLDNKKLTKDEEEKLIKSFGAEVKKHITDIASKYIIPGKTAEYALMFVPSDGILSLIHSELTNVISYAYSKKVMIVSPTTLLPLLSSYYTVVLDHERSKYAAEIDHQLKLLKKEFQIFDGDWKKLNNAIQTLTRQSYSVNTRVEKITSKFNQINTVAFQDEVSDENNTAENSDSEEIEADE